MGYSKDDWRGRLLRSVEALMGALTPTPYVPPTSTHLRQHRRGEHDEGSDGEDDECELPSLNHAEDEARDEGGEELHEHPQLVADTLLDLVHVTVIGNDMSMGERQ
jgi:hypothetical protein